MGTLHIKWLNWVVVLKPTTDLIRDEEADELDRALTTALAENYQGIVVNLRDVGRMSSDAFGILLSCWKRANQTETKLGLCCAPQSLLEILKLIEFPPEYWNSGGRYTCWFRTEEEAVRFCSER